MIECWKFILNTFYVLILFVNKGYVMNKLKNFLLLVVFCASTESVFALKYVSCNGQDYTCCEFSVNSTDDAKEPIFNKEHMTSCPQSTSFPAYGFMGVVFWQPLPKDSCSKGSRVYTNDEQPPFTGYDSDKTLEELCPNFTITSSN
jgi:hypothetical protein